MDSLNLMRIPCRYYVFFDEKEIMVFCNVKEDDKDRYFDALYLAEKVKYWYIEVD